MTPETLIVAVLTAVFDCVMLLYNVGVFTDVFAITLFSYDTPETINVVVFTNVFA